MRKVDLPHYGLYGIHQTGANGIFDFLRSDKAIASREVRKDSRLDYRAESGQARRDARYERGQLRREKRIIKSENRVTNTQNGTSTIGNIAGSLISLFKKKEPSYPMDDPSQYAQIDTTTKTNAAGGWIMGGVLVSMVLGTLYFTNKKEDPKKK